MKRKQNHNNLTQTILIRSRIKEIVLAFLHCVKICLICKGPHKYLPGLLKLYFASISQRESEESRPLEWINYGETQMFILVSSSACESVESVYVSNTARNKSASSSDPVLHGVSQGLSRNSPLRYASIKAPCCNLIGLKLLVCYQPWQWYQLHNLIVAH